MILLSCVRVTPARASEEAPAKTFTVLGQVVDEKRARVSGALVRRVTPDTALRLSRVVGMSPDFWLGLQQDWDRWHAMRGERAAEIRRLAPLAG